MAQNSLGIDIGGTRMRAAVVSPKGEVLSRAECQTPSGSTPDDIVAQVAEIVLQASRNHAPGTIAAAGVCAPGPLDAQRGIAIATPTISGFLDYPLRDRIAAAIGLPTFLDHDGHAAAYGEWKFGAGQGHSNMVYVTVSTGIGGGAIVDGALQRGRKGMAAHVGHMTIAPDGPRCACGNHGCWEAMAAGPAFSAAAREAGFHDGAAVFDSARTGDPKAIDLVEKQSYWLAVGLVNLIHIYSPDLVVLGGGVITGMDLMLPYLQAHIAQRAMPPFRDVPFVQAGLMDNAGVVGAAALGRGLFLAGHQNQ